MFWTVSAVILLVIFIIFIIVIIKWVKKNYQNPDFNHKPPSSSCGGGL